MKKINKSNKLENVCYEIRGPILIEAKKMEDEGHRILKLNIGNPAPFGFEAPDDILKDVIHNLPKSQGYSDSNGIYSARVAVMQYYQQKNVKNVKVEDIFIGNGVSELIVMAMQGLVNNDDEVLIPAPDYPLWTAAVSLASGVPVHYRCDETNGWQPDIQDIRNKITDKTKAIVLITLITPLAQYIAQNYYNKSLSWHVSFHWWLSVMKFMTKFCMTMQNITVSHQWHQIFFVSLWEGCLKIIA